MLNAQKTNNIANKIRLKADAFRNSNSYQLAIKEYLSAILFNKKDADAYLGLGISYKYLNKTDKAIKAFEKAAEISDLNAEVFYELGICYLIDGQVFQAMKNLKKSIRLDNKNLNAQIQLAIAHEAISEQEMALLIYKHIIETAPYFVKAYEHAAFLLIDLNRFEEAGQYLAKLIKIYPECTHAYLGLGACMEKLNNNQSARRYYKKFLSLTSDNEQKNMVIKKLKTLCVSKKNKQSYLTLLS